MMVDIGAEHDAAERPHQKAGAEGHESEHQLGEFAAGRKEGPADRHGVIAKDEKVVHFQKVAARDADHRPDLVLALFSAEPRHGSPSASRGYFLSCGIMRTMKPRCLCPFILPRDSGEDARERPRSRSASRF